MVEGVGSTVGGFLEDVGDFLGFQTGTPSVPSTGLYRLHEGERVLSKTDNAALIEAINRGGGPINIVVKVGSEEFHAFIDRRADKIVAEAEPRFGTGATTRQYL